MAILKLAPCYKDYLWGGRRLIDEYGKKFDGDVLAESWELACHKDGNSIILNDEYKGMTLAEYIEKKGKGILGKNCEGVEEFPILIKLIDAKDHLSIQVHPDDEYARKVENQYGKTEVWYVLDCKPNSYLYYGFNKDISKKEVRDRIENDTILEVLNKVEVKKGDVLFIKPGTIHAIGKDILVAEIQQNSNVTYRVYDYARVGKDGKKRELHIDKAVEVLDYSAVDKKLNTMTEQVRCKYFTVDYLQVDANTNTVFTGKTEEDSFASILVLNGSGMIRSNDEEFEFKKGDSFFVEANSGTYVISGDGEMLLTKIPSK